MKTAQRPTFFPPGLLREWSIALALAGLPLLPHLPVGSLALFYLLLLYRFAAIARPRWLPGQAELFLLTLLGGTVVWLQSGGIFGKTAGSALLLVGSGLKLLELHSRRDVLVVVALAFILAFDALLFSQSIASAVYAFFEVAFFTAALTGLHCDSAKLPWRRRMRHSLVWLVQIVPLAALLFLFVPRIPGPLWHLPEEKAAKTGLSDRLQFGSISRLGLSDDLAFRADFTGPVPPPSQRYWRGPVFWWTDGQRWEMRPIPAKPNRAEHYSGPAWNYTIILEPHGQKWLMALDLPQSHPQDSDLSGDFQLLAYDDIRDRRLYTMRSYPHYRYSDLSADERYWGLQLPAYVAQPVRQLAASWRSGYSDEEVVRQALAYFHDNDFRYTLEPPPLPNRMLERFLLETRQGFCEHYATAFVLLMRLAGIPARVVTGYQGGFWNSVGQFIEVRQSDAHAWAEVWLNQQGWVRIDPTAAVAPERIDQSAVLAAFATENTKGWQPLAARTWLPSLRSLWANLDHGWHRWVLGYGLEHRRNLLEWFTKLSWPRLATWFAATCLAVSLPFFWLYWRDRSKAAIDPAQQCYAQFCARLARRGLVRAPTEGPVDFAQRAVRALPDCSDAVQAVTNLYLEIRYSGLCQEEKLRLLRKKVRQFT
jgi:transglutaminase-like putative cysteine protease